MVHRRHSDSSTTTSRFGVRENIKQSFKDIFHHHSRKKRSSTIVTKTPSEQLPPPPTLPDLSNTQSSSFRITNVNLLEDDDDDMENILPHHHSYEFPAPVQTLFQVANETTTTTTTVVTTVLSPPPSVVLPPETRQQQTSQSSLHLEPIQNTKSATIARVKAASRSRSALYTLPKINRNLTQLEEEFRNMLEHFANYSEADILSIADPRLRALFEGIAASAHTMPVYRAFEILFEDLLPLRVAGRLIFNRLKAFMQESITQREQDVQRAMKETGLQQEDTLQMEEIRLMFVTTASLLNGDSYLTVDQLEKTGIISSTATEVLGFDNPKQLLQLLNGESKDGKLTFVELMMGLWHAAETLCGIEKCNPHAVMHNLLVELNEHPPTTPTDTNAKLDANRRKFGARYDDMVSAFVEWEYLLPPPQGHEGRRMEVVRGCFVGAKNPKIVDALRIVYSDYAALRIAGDVIFKLVSSILNNRNHHNNNNNNSSR